MGKSLPGVTKLQHLAKVTGAAHHLNTTGKNPKPTTPNRRIIGEDNKPNSKKKMESSSASQRLPLSEVVSDCVKRWFKDSLKEAKAGDVNMQVLVGQMYYSGYGVPRDAQKVSPFSFPHYLVPKGKNLDDKGVEAAVFSLESQPKASRFTSVNISYNASDSDSDEIKGDS
ncbi:hypothetical protein Golob_002714 [Gossypium lobatum]|uniref:Uncharacterized protein n=1 Tax=Gossypium lobatum TaxID=34289 RepID=A0A7J8N5Y3_9ROSI|nr:hypothetical protein [Gossypium lobatum]